MSQVEASQLLGLAGKHRPYPEYKGAGVEWVGDVPEHWRVGRLGSFGYFIAGCGFPHEDQGRQDEIYPFYKVSDTNHVGNEKYLSKADNYVSKDIASKLGARICSAGGIMFPKVGAALLGNKRRILTQPSITDNNTMVYFSYEGDSSYWYYWLSLLDFGQLSNPGPVPSINESQLKDFVAICPTQGERQQIAAFLDYETARIDRLIAQQLRLIELLKEKRQAVISHAVTKGLNPDAPMKDSGIEWLGQVPEHWEVTRLKYIGDAKNGLTYSPDDVVSEGDGVLVLRSSNIQNAKLSFTDNVYVNMDIPGRIRTKKNDLLICSRNGSRKLIGKNALITEEAIGMAFGAFMVLYRSNLNSYLYWVLNSPLFEYQSGSFLTSTINQLTIGNLGSMEIPLPPCEEREMIERSLKEKDSYFERLVQLSNRKVELLQERRTALISAAVTGKIDLRGWTPPAEEVAA
ncbi:restriction endonuclease subunit S [Aeromonas caviae]|uniref:restriction endonuclease subunit S n=1 Tax=Aeromonas caviae TaxID=648 RepID=UPI0038D00F17